MVRSRLQLKMEQRTRLAGGKSNRLRRYLLGPWALRQSLVELERTQELPFPAVAVRVRVVEMAEARRVCA